MDVRRFRGGDHLLLGRLLAPEADILPHGGMTHPGVLQNHTDGAAQRGTRQRADIFSVDRDVTAGHVVETHNQIDERRLPAPGRPDDGNALSRLRLERKVTHERHLGYIGERNMGECDLPPRILEQSRVIGVRDFRLRRYEFFNPQSTGKGILQLGHDAGNFIERFGVLVGV